MSEKLICVYIDYEIKHGGKSSFFVEIGVPGVNSKGKRISFSDSLWEDFKQIISKNELLGETFQYNLLECGGVEIAIKVYWIKILGTSFEPIVRGLIESLRKRV